MVSLSIKNLPNIKDSPCYKILKFLHELFGCLGNKIIGLCTLYQKKYGLGSFCFPQEKNVLKNLNATKIVFSKKSQHINI